MDSAGGCGKLTKALKEHPDRHAQGARWRMGKIVHYDISEKYCLWQPNAQKINQLIEWCDCIITTGPCYKLPRNLPWGTKSLIPPDAPKRKVIINYRGTPYRGSRKYYNAEDKKRGYIQSGNFLDLVVSGELKYWIPVPVWIDEFAKYKQQSKQFIVVQPVTMEKRFPLKSTPGVIKVLKGMKGINLDIVHDLEPKECLKRIGKADVVITAFKNGPGNAGLEAMSMGIPIIGNGFDDYITKVRELGNEKTFFYQSSVAGLPDAVADLRDNPDVYQDYVKRGYDWLKKYHDPMAIAEKVASIAQHG